MRARAWNKTGHFVVASSLSRQLLVATSAEPSNINCPWNARQITLQLRIPVDPVCAALFFCRGRFGFVRNLSVAHDDANRSRHTRRSAPAPPLYLSKIQARSQSSGGAYLMRRRQSELLPWRTRLPLQFFPEFLLPSWSNQTRHSARREECRRS